MGNGTKTVYEQSAVIPFRRRGNDVEILLVTSRSGKRWIVPKGMVDPDLTPEDSAVKEAYEEAGITGALRSDCLGTYYYDKWGGTCEVEIFLFEVETEHDDWLEADKRKRRWVRVREAIELVEEPGLKRFLRSITEHIN